MVAKQILKFGKLLLYLIDLKVFLFKRIQGLVHLSPQNPLGVVWLSLTGN